MLPEEAEAKAYIQHRHRAALDGMSQLHTLAVSALTPFRTTTKPGFDETVHLVSLALYVKACKQFRSIQLLCEAGLGADANAVTRNLFETAIALAFVLRARIRLKRGGKPVPKVKGRPFGRRLRARLFLAHVAFEKQRTLDEWSRTPGLKRSAKSKIDATIVAQGVVEAEGAIGKEWTDQLRKGKSYSGLTLKELVQSLRLGQIYATLYRAGSWSVHGGADIGQFVTETAGGPALLLAASDAEIEPAMGGASVLMTICLGLLEDAYSLRLSSAIKTHRLRLGMKR